MIKIVKHKRKYLLSLIPKIHISTEIMDRVSAMYHKGDSIENNPKAESKGIEVTVF